jgi:hypothetical protein
MSGGACVARADLTFYQPPDDPGSVEITEGFGLAGFPPLAYANRGRRERYARSRSLAAGVLAPADQS